MVAAYQLAIDSGHPEAKLKYYVSRDGNKGYARKEELAAIARRGAASGQAFPS